MFVFFSTGLEPEAALRNASVFCSQLSPSFLWDTNVPKIFYGPVSICSALLPALADNKSVKDLLSLLSADLAEPMPLERAEIFVAQALPVALREAWQLVPVQGTVDLTQTETWQNYSSLIGGASELAPGFFCRENK